MIKMYLQIEKLWFLVSEKIRFLLVGGFNTVFAYVLYVLLVAGMNIGYKLALIIGYIISINVSIFTMRYYVFRSKGKWYAEYLKGWEVYLATLLLNYVAMFLMVDWLEINELLAQAVFAIIVAVLTYVFHKYFTFHKR